MSKGTKLLKNTAIIAIGNICTKCVSFFLLPLYTALLSSSDYGTVDLITTYTSLLVILFTCQMEQGVFRFLIESRGNRQSQKEYVSTVFWFLLTLNIVTVIVGGIVLSAVGYKYTGYLLFNIFFGVFNALVLSISRGLGENTTYATGSFLNGSFHVLLNVIFIVYLHYKVEGMLVAGIMSILISNMYVIVKLKLWKYIKISYIKRNSFADVSKYSLPLIPYTLTWWIMNASNRSIINMFLGTAANGIFAVANKFPTMFSMVTNIFQMSWLESAAENINDDSRESYYQSVMDKTIRFYSSGNCLIIAAIPLVFNILINGEFYDAYNYIPMLMVGALFHSIASLYGSIYFAFKETKSVTKTTVISAIINVLTSLIFVKYMGLYAAAFATMISYIIVVAIRYFDIRRMTDISLSKKYMLSELLLYAVIVIVYYTKIMWLQFITLMLLIPICCIRNKELIVSMFTMIKEKISPKNRRSI